MCKKLVDTVTLQVLAGTEEEVEEEEEEEEEVNTFGDLVCVC